MRITHLNKRYWPHVGGVERSLHGIARACVRQGDQVTALVCAGRPLPAHRRLDGVDILEAPSFGVVQSQPIAPSYLRLPDIETVWHLHEPFPLGTLAMLLHTRGRRRPLIITWHSDVVRQRALKPLHDGLAKELLRRARFIHVPTEGHAANSALLSQFRSKLRPIPFIVDIQATRRRSDHPLAASIRHWANGRPIALAVGRLVYYKGVGVLLDAIALIRDVCLVIVGEGPLRKQLESRVQELAISERVRWLGQISDDDLAGAFSGADVFVLPSVAPSEAFGLVQVEAMAAGLPVVSTRLGTSVEIVNVDGATGTVVEPGDPRALALAIRALVHDEALRGRLSAGALKHAGEFAEDRLVKLYRDLYAAAAEG